MNFKNYSYLFFLIGFSLFTFSCVDQEFDSPPPDGVDPDLEATGSVSDLLALHELDQATTITEDITLEVLVAADDRSGNFFRTLIVQDESGGIAMRLDGTDSYTRYPTGRRLFIKCQGLVVGDFAGTPQLGLGIEDSEVGLIPRLLESQFIFSGQYGLEVIPNQISINDLGFAELNTLITLTDVRVNLNPAYTSFADVVGERAGEHDVVECATGASILLRSSNFSDFATEEVPLGSGSITGIYTKFLDTDQFVIRNPNDVQFTNESCNANVAITPIAEVRTQHEGFDTNAEAGFIRGVVISDVTSGNLVDQNLFLQDETAGITVRFTSPHSFNLGDEIEVNVSGADLEEFGGLLQVSNLSLANATILSSGNEPMARTASLTEVLQNSKAWESTLVKIPGVTLTGNSVFDGVLTVSSDNASIDMFTRFSANFANNPVPEGEVELTAIVSSFNEVAQLVMRNGTDVTGGTPGDGGGDGGGDPGGSTELDTVSMISEMFNSVGVDEDFASSGWTNTALQGTRLWRGKIFDDNLYVQATSFADNDPNMEAWLVTPGINLEEASSLSFESAKAFYDHDGLSVFVSSDYDGDVGAATWEPINARIATASDPDHDWIGSGNIDLDVYEGIIHIGFRYIGDNSNNDTSYRIDNIVVQ